MKTAFYIPICAVLIVYLASFIEPFEDKIFHLTTEKGAPINDNRNLLTVGPYGPGLLQDRVYLNKLSHFDRERIPERVVHAKGSGAHGYFEVTNDISQYTKADVFSKVGKVTPVFTRFSTVIRERGSPDTVRDPRGFAVKFYTEEGNWDLVSNNLPVFFIRDPMQFPDLIHSQKPHPQTGFRDENTYWDFLSLTPESLNMVTHLFSDLGIPDGYMHMNGFGVNTFRLIDHSNRWNYVKFHWVSNQGLKNLTDNEAKLIAGLDRNRDRRLLFNTIAEGKFPSWQLKIQIMSPEQARSFGPDAIDPTKLWPIEYFPLIDVGRLTLNRNPKNFFAETEQAAFCTANVVPGIDFSEDKLLVGRVLSYDDTQRYRLGTNFHQIPINQPKVPIFNFMRDGKMMVTDNFGPTVNYEPNSFGTPQSVAAALLDQPNMTYSGPIGRFNSSFGDDFSQAGNLYRSFTEGEKDRLVMAIAQRLNKVLPLISSRQISLFKNADNEYGERVEKVLRQMREFT